MTVTPTTSAQGTTAGLIVQIEVQPEIDSARAKRLAALLFSSAIIVQPSSAVA